MDKARIIVAALTLSASAFVTLVVSEGYTDTATIPTKNDRPTNGFGSTFNADGSSVKLGEKPMVNYFVDHGVNVDKEDKVNKVKDLMKS